LAGFGDYKRRFLLNFLTGCYTIRAAAPRATVRGGLPWFRDADNLTYLCQSLSEGQQLLGRAARHLDPWACTSGGGRRTGRWSRGRSPSTRLALAEGRTPGERRPGGDRVGQRQASRSGCSRGLAGLGRIV